MVVIEVVSDPPGGSTTFDGSMRGDTPISIWIDLGDIFREDCLLNGEVICDWNTLRVWLESKQVGEMWWDLTFAERYSIAHMATSNVMNFLIQYFKRDAGCGFGEHEHSGECSSNTTIRCVKFDRAKGCLPESGLCSWKKDGSDIWHNYLDEKSYGIPCFFAGYETHVMAAIGLNRTITTLDDLFIFQYDEIDIQPGRLQLPYGKSMTVAKPDETTCIGKISGTVVATIEIAQPGDIFREDCLLNGEVICDWDTLRVWLESKQVGEMWWDLTFDERYSIAHMATSNVMNFLIQYFKRDAGCGFGECDHEGECSSNSAIRFTKFNYLTGCRIESGLCHWKKDDEDIWHNYLDEKSYGIPCFFVHHTVAQSHMMMSIALNKKIDGLRDLFIFQYEDIDIQPGNIQLPHGNTIRVLTPATVGCLGGVDFQEVIEIEVP